MGDGVASVDVDAVTNRLTLVLCRLFYVLLQRDGAFRGAGGGGEPDHEAVAHGFDLGAAVGGERFAGDALVLAEDGAGGLVAEALVEGSGAFDISEDDRADGADIDLWRSDGRS